MISEKLRRSCLGIQRGIISIFLASGTKQSDLYLATWTLLAGKLMVVRLPGRVSARLA